MLPAAACFSRKNCIANPDAAVKTQDYVTPVQHLNSFYGSDQNTPKSCNLPTILAWQTSNSFNAKTPLVKRAFFMPRHKEINRLEDFYDVAKDKLGEGGFGTVRCATLKGADLMRVVKSVEKSKADAAERAKREIEILKRLDHPNICRLHESFEDASHIHMVLEYIKGRELYDELLAQGHLDEESALFIMSKIFSALQYCHHRMIMHRDLKPENVMVQRASDRAPCAGTPKTPLSRHGGSVIKVIDFGLGTICSTGIRQSTVLGTKHYIAPEVMRGNYGFAADVWSAGVIFHTLLVGQPPSQDFRNGDLNVRSVAMQSGLWCSVSEGSKELALGVLAVNESERLSARAALTECTTLGKALIADSSCLPNGFSSPLSKMHAVEVMSRFMAFHRSEKLRRAALTAVAMQLTDSQIHGLREQFQAIDIDSDGHISREELEQAMATLFSGETQEIALANVETVFESVDTDGSGVIDFSEFCAAALKNGTALCEKAILAAFRVFDTDSNGQITKKELSDVLMSHGGDLSVVELDELVDSWDADEDGQLSFDEFRAMVLNLGKDMSFPNPNIVG